MPVTISPASHLDHGLSPEAITWLLGQFTDRNEFFIASVELPAQFSEIDCALHGPVVGDNPIEESEVFYQMRKGRGNYSRLCKRAPRKTRTVTVIAGPNEGDPCVLYTAFGGPLAPKETGDVTIKSESEREASEKFWAEHALSG